MVQEKIKLLAITGPTAVGKSAFAVKAALELGGEIVGADSMQVYKGMNIGTGKIKPDEMCGVPHYMLDVAMPDEDYSVGRYVPEARKAIADIAQRGALPIVVGGTGLYISSLLYSRSFAGTPKDENLRASLREFALQEGAQALHDRLKEVDPQSAAQIEINDVKRTVRALEINLLTGLPRSAFKDDDVPVYDYRLLVLTDERERLYSKINDRVDKMFDNGLIDEVKGLYAYKDCNSMQAIGYKEVVEYLDGKSTLDEAVEAVKSGSRRYAKRQMTFFRGMKADKTFLDVAEIAQYKINDIFKKF